MSEDRTDDVPVRRTDPDDVGETNDVPCPDLMDRTDIRSSKSAEPFPLLDPPHDTSVSVKATRHVSLAIFFLVIAYDYRA